MSFVKIDADANGEARLFLYGLSYRLPGETVWVQGATQFGYGQDHLPGPLARGIRRIPSLLRGIAVMHPLTAATLLLAMVLSLCHGDAAWLGAAFC